MDLEPPSFRYGRFCSVLLDWSIRFDSIQFGWCGQLGLVVLPTTLMLWVSLAPWRKGFPVIAGLPLSSPPPPGETPGYFYCRIFLFGVGALEILFVGWTPRLCLSNSTSRFTTPFLLHSDRFVGWTPGPLFWLDPSPVPFKFEVSLPNATLITQRFLVGPLGYFWGLRPSPLPFEFEISLPTRLYCTTIFCWLDPWDIIFWSDLSPLPFKF